MRSRPWLTLEWWRFDGPPRGEWRGDRILLDVRLGRVERRCVLMHELVHQERGIGFPAATAATMQREEKIVEQATASRLVPEAALVRFVEKRMSIGEGVTARCVAERFDVTVGVAETALQGLVRRAGVAV